MSVQASRSASALGRGFSGTNARELEEPKRFNSQSTASRSAALIPRRLFLTKGVGKHKEKLQSFELALRDAGIQHCNLVQVSSIVPAGCRVIPKDKGRVMLTPGEVTFVMLARNATREPNRLIAASVGLAIPSTKTYGYISEHHAYGQTEEVAGDYAEDLAATMLATTMGIAFDSAEGLEGEGAALQGQRAHHQDVERGAVRRGRQERPLDIGRRGRGPHPLADSEQVTGAGGSNGEIAPALNRAPGRF